MKSKAGFTRQLQDAGMAASEAALDGDDGAAALATVLAAVGAAFGQTGTAAQRQQLEHAARATLAGASDVPAWLPVPRTPLARARFVKARARVAMAAGGDEEAVARAVLAAIRWAWGVSSGEARVVLSDKRVRLAIVQGDPAAVTRAALRAAGVAFDRNLFSADAQAARRSQR